MTLWPVDGLSDVTARRIERREVALAYVPRRLVIGEAEVETGQQALIQRREAILSRLLIELSFSDPEDCSSAPSRQRRGQSPARVQGAWAAPPERPGRRP
jgi:hypothetical protein